MKRALSIALAFFFCLAFGAGCIDNKRQNTQNGALTVYAPDGAPALAIAQFIANGDKLGFEQNIDYNVVSAGDVKSYVNGAKGYGDIVILPVNAASQLYNANKNDPYKMAAVITHGNLYIMTTDENPTVAGLKGKVLGVIGQGLVPDLTLRAVLKRAGFEGSIAVGDTAAADKITLRYFGAASDMLPLMIQGKLTYGLLPEPAATNLESKASNKTFHRISLQTAYNADKGEYPQAVVMIKSSIVNEYPVQVAGLEEKFTAAATWAKQNPADAVNAINGNITEKNKGFAPSLQAASITAEAVEGCNIRWQSSAIAKEQVKSYVADIISVGVGLDILPAKQVEDDFFIAG